jgi:hypothetical protein
MYTYSLAPGGAEEQIFPALAAQAPVDGKEYTALNTVGTFTTAGASVYGAFIPLKFSNNATVASLVLRAGVAYSGSALSFRLGIYSDNNGVPGALLIDAGTITWSGITLGQTVTIACSQALSANVQYWVVVGCSYASGAPSMHATVGNNLPMANIGLMGELGAAGYYFNHNGANALPSTAPTVTAAGYLFPRVYVRLAS